MFPLDPPQDRSLLPIGYFFGELSFFFFGGGCMSIFFPLDSSAEVRPFGFKGVSLPLLRLTPAKVEAPPSEVSVQNHGSRA